MPRILIVIALIWLGSANAPIARAQESSTKTVPSGPRWKDAASRYRIALDLGKSTPLTFREEPVLRWTNPERRTDDGAVFVWTDRGRPEVAASFYRYKRDEKISEDHEFISLSEGPILAKLDGETLWTVPSGNVRPTLIPDAIIPGATSVERLRQMRGLAREFKATFNNPPDLSEIRLLTQPIYRFEVEGKRTDVVDGALFAFVHATDPEVLLSIEARPTKPDGPLAWHYSIVRMSMVNLRVHHKDREVWSASWQSQLTDPTKPYMVRNVAPTP